jgi:alpha-beta hydrolase superfamily lysophospholipase
LPPASSKVADTSTADIAGADKLVDPRGSEAFAAATPTEMLSVCRYPDAFHEILNEPLPNPAWADMRQWLTRHSATAFSATRQRA